tara:strand:- start:626 stop:1093 length:468 start_codon:yes stop_codon:yes gene_type:complete
MKKIIENWRIYIKESKIIDTKEQLIDLIKQDPDQEIYLDNPKGTTKKFGGALPRKLPFDYGEYTKLINAADDMGWDIILMPGSKKGDTNLLPVGHISYHGEEELWKSNDREVPENIEDNHKIFLAQDGEYSQSDKDLMEQFFKQLWQFKEIQWYD